jgi:5-methyltetrahydropteroyltriglutamate--homocysteine methyltransferase
MEVDTLVAGANQSDSVLPFLEIGDSSYGEFEREVVDSFIDKLRSGIDIPNYPQFRDMNKMFLDMIHGVKKGDEGYVALDELGIKTKAIPETLVLKRNLSEIKDRSGREGLDIKACITGPYTLSSLFRFKSPKLVLELGDCLSKIVSHSLFDKRQGGIRFLSIDEPVLGFIDEPFLDHGTEGRESVKRALEDICYAASVRGVETSLHLHNTSNDIFWEIEHLDILESHVEDPIYDLKSTREKLKETGKRLKASIGITFFDKLIQNYVINEGLGVEVQERIGEIWNKIDNGLLDPSIFLEKREVMVRRLDSLLERFGEENIPYAGPECGFGSFPTYESAIQYMKRIAGIVGEY